MQSPPPERIIIAARPDKRYVRYKSIPGYLLSLVGILLSLPALLGLVPLRVILLGAPMELSQPYYALCAILFMAGASYAGAQAFTLRLLTKFLITNRKIQWRHGLKGFGSKSRDIAVADLRQIDVDQNIVEEWLHVGRLSLNTAANEGPELVLQGVRDPHRIKNLINEARGLTTGPFDVGSR